MPDTRSLPDAHDALIITHSKTEASVEPLELGKRVKQIRLSQQLTLEEASKRTGLASSTLSKIENEHISPTFSAVHKLVNGLGIDIPQLFDYSSKYHITRNNEDEHCNLRLQKRQARFCHNEIGRFFAGMFPQMDCYDQLVDLTLRPTPF